MKTGLSHTSTLNIKGVPKILISGGGTGGHVFPAIAIAQEIRKKQPDAEILFVGAKGKIEMEKVPKAGFKIEGLWISGFHRKLTFRNLAFPFKLMSSLWKAFRIVKRFKPDVVVGVGGYASGPVLEIASRLKIPTLIQEQNSFPGITNRLLASKVNGICVAYEGLDRFFPREKIEITGNPVRKDLIDIDINSRKAKAHFGFDENKKTIVVLGGSLGAKSINEAMNSNLDLLKEHTEIEVLWQIGKLYIEDFSNCIVASLPNVKTVTFIERMDMAYAAADILICRAGALTISELCLVGKPSILIPSPNVAEDHQRKNALALVEKEAAILIEDKQAKDFIISKPLRLLEDDEMMSSLGSNIKSMARPNATEHIASRVLSLIKS